MVICYAEETESLSSTWRQKNIRTNPFPIAPFYAHVIDKLELGKVEQIPSSEIAKPSLGEIVQANIGQGRVVQIQPDLIHIRVGYEIEKDCTNLASLFEYCGFLARFVCRAVYQCKKDAQALPKIQILEVCV